MDNFWNKTEKKLVFSMDCLSEQTENYFEIGETSVVNAPFGSYREAAHVKGSRFGYKFYVEDKGEPHLLEICYPDDKPRFMCVQNGTSYDLNTGILTGGDGSEPSGTMKTVYVMYWPRWHDDSIVFTSYNFPVEEPAAIASFKVYRLYGLPETELPAECYEKGKRTIGMQYEDPCNVGTTEGSYEFYTWLEHHIRYMKLSGQNVLAYPIHWYHGPNFPVKSQPHSRFNALCCENRLIYTRSSFDTPDWPEYLLSRFDEEGLHFKGTLTYMRLGNLMKVQNNDTQSVKAGAPTINNVLFDGNVQTSTNDWTICYNSWFFPKWMANFAEGKKTSDIKEFEYGEKRTTSVSTPIFNPLAPEVRRQTLEYFDEICAKYAKHPSFDGLSVNFWHGTMLWYGNLLCGYDDISFGLFEKECGIVSGISYTDPERAQKRYAYVMANCKERFVSFRCEKIREFILKIRDVMRKHRPDLTLGLNVWNETSIFGYLPGCGHLPASASPASKFGNRMSNYELYREGGLDLKLFENDEGIELCVEHNSGRDRSKLCLGLEEAHKFDDFAYLDGDLNSALRNSGRSVGFHFDCWVELWGTHTKFEMPKDDTNREFIYNLPDYKADYVFREHSTYEDDPEGKFFFASELRICSPYPNAGRYLEHLTMDIALHDALSLTSGGLYLDKTHIKEKAELAKEYRRLPCVPFTDLSSDGPVVVRWHFDGSTTYVYAVNREPYALPVEIKLSNGKLCETVAPFMLKVWTLEGEQTPVSASAAVCESIKKAYAEKAKATLELLEKADANAPWAKGKDRIASMIKESLAKEKYADLRHLLKCYIVEKAKSLA